MALMLADHFWKLHAPRWKRMTNRYSQVEFPRPSLTLNVFASVPFGAFWTICKPPDWIATPTRPEDAAGE